MRTRNALLLALAAAALLAPAGVAAPTCTGSMPTAACGDRVIPDPLRAATFLQYGSDVFPALDAIEKIAPEVVEVRTLAEWTGNKKYVSAGGLQLPVIRLTDERVPRSHKKKVVVSLSIHANEPAGREGGLRYVENVARWWKSDRKHVLYAGDVAMPLDKVLAGTEVWLGIVNADGWAAGDLGKGVYSRTNKNGTDLNREFPTVGWTNRPATPLSDPESQGWTAFVRSLGHVTTASDIHGELNSDNKAYADLMWPAAQWTPRMQAQELQLGRHMIKSVERKFQDQAVVMGIATDTAGVQAPSNAATGYDVVGYDDGGFMGDWLAQERGAVEIDAENFLSHSVPMNAWFGPLEQAHVAATQGIIETLMVEALVTQQVRPSLRLGKVAYAFDPRRVRSADGRGYANESGDKPKAYDVSRMRYFDDLRAAAPGSTVQPVNTADIVSGRAHLSRYDTLVLADDAMPPDAKGRKVDATKYRAAIQAFVRGGGQLLLTDAAVPFVRYLGITGDSAMRTATTNAGHIDFGALDHPWEKGLSSTASQTYYEVPLGFGPTNEAPHFGVTTADWAAKKGVTVGTVSDSTGAFTALGSMPYGAGSVAIFGALLPTPTEENDHVEGLKDYGVTITGGQVLNAILGYRRH
jgi:hypothetical protein